ncbi:MAG: 2-octaprenyl-6-methoxyphenyl hydroxylase [Alphaproteobacteria bacterium]|nr:2-octaprenyl-6-methoxyphenyl hydroxylase [Alphaproteobacteria bacterium]
MTDRFYDVVIAGGGFVGQSLALALAKIAPRGFRIALVDAEPSKSGDAIRDARASALSAATKNLLSVLDVWPKLAPDAQAIESIEITDSPLHAGLRPHLLGFGDDELKEGEPSAFMVENRDIQHALAAVVAEQPAIDSFTPGSITDFESDAFRVVSHFATGETIEAALLVAADGKRSQLRERAGIKCVSWSYPQRGIITTVTHTIPHQGRATQHFLPAGPFAILPLKGNRSAIVWTEEKDRAETIIASNEADFLSELTTRFGNHLGELAIVGPIQSFPLDFQVARNFVTDRMVLVGDAAHVVHPLAGQGLNIGMRDVAALTEIVVEATRLGLDIGSPVQLEHYQRWRRFDSAFSAAVMDGLNRLFSNDNAPLRALRDLGLGVVDRAPALKRFFVREAAGTTGNAPRLLLGESF